VSVVAAVLLILVSFSGAVVVVMVVKELVAGGAESNWEYLIAMILGAGILVWPVSIANNHNQNTEEELLLQIFELGSLESYLLENTASGQLFNIRVDPKTGQIDLAEIEAAQDNEPSDNAGVPEDEEPIEASPAEAQQADTSPESE